MTVTKLAYSIAEAAEAYGVSRALITKAIHTADPGSWPPPLTAKRVGGNGRYSIRAVDLQAWHDSFPDA